LLNLVQIEANKDLLEIPHVEVDILKLLDGGFLTVREFIVARLPYRLLAVRQGRRVVRLVLIAAQVLKHIDCSNDLRELTNLIPLLLVFLFLTFL